jgi:hypothetical protein
MPTLLTLWHSGWPQRKRDLQATSLSMCRASLGSGLVSDVQTQFGFNRLFSCYHRSLLQLDFRSSRQVENATRAAQTEKRTQFW